MSQQATNSIRVPALWLVANRVGRYFVVMAMLMLTVAFSSPAFTLSAQEDSTGETQEDVVDAQPATSADAVAEDLPSLLTQWKSLETEMIALQDKMAEEKDVAATQEMRASYVDLNGKALALIEQIETAAVQELNDGKTDQTLMETLAGLVMNHASFDRDQAALDLGQQMINAGVDSSLIQTASTAERLTPAAKEVMRELALRAAESAADDLPRVQLTTNKGNIVLELFENEAPQTVGNFVNLVESGFYDGVSFHRVIDGFMAQTGDPNGDGSGGPGYNIYCECYKSDFRRHFTGSLSMAKLAPRDTGGSQFFITFSRTSELDGKHTVFGRVIEGMDVVNNLQRIDPQNPDRPQPDQIIKAEVLRKRDHEYVPTKVSN